jgi:hypothetical protein
MRLMSDLVVLAVCWAWVLVQAVLLFGPLLALVLWALLRREEAR